MLEGQKKLIINNNCSGNITSINKNGQIAIKFNDKMNTLINLSWINESNTDMYVLPQDKRKFDDNFNKSMLNFTWVVHSYKNDTMIVNSTFYFPLEISPSPVLDKLFIYFNQSQYLINCLSYGTLSDNSTTMSNNVPK